MSKFFTDQHKQWCIENYPKLSRKALTEAFNFAFSESRKVSQITAYLKNNKIKSGRTAHFVKGQKGWNTGTKGVCKANSGSFKKGQRPHNWMPIGTERIIEGGYIEVKTAEPHEWTAKHRVAYSEKYGAIPKGQNVRFRDGNVTNYDLDNLFLASNAEHQRLNTMGFKHHPSETKDSLILIAKVQTRIDAVTKENANA
jgi:hypothetical protein